MYPRARFEALTDGIFAVAMTLLVLDLRLPENFHPHNAEELLRGLYDLVPNFIPYVLSFLVLGLRAPRRKDLAGVISSGGWLTYC